MILPRYSPGDGMTGEINAPTSVNMAIAAFVTIAWFNALELNVRIWDFFRVRRGLYFWSLLIGSWACIVYPFGSLSQYYGIIDNQYANVTITFVSWITVVTGASLVLYSRLHLVVQNRKTLRLVLIMIIADAFLFHIPTGVFHYLSQEHPQYLPTYDIFEKLEVTAFCVQEFIICALYIYYLMKMLKPGKGLLHEKGRDRKVLLRLLQINILIVILDLIIVTTQGAGQFEIQTTFKAAVYSFKLRIEFSILNQLMEILGNKQRKHFTPDDRLNERGSSKYKRYATGSGPNGSGPNGSGPNKSDSDWVSTTNTLNADRHAGLPPKGLTSYPGESPSSTPLTNMQARNPTSGPRDFDNVVPQSVLTADPYALPVQKPKPAPHHGQPVGLPSPSDDEKDSDDKEDRFFQRMGRH